MGRRTAALRLDELGNLDGALRLLERAVQADDQVEVVLYGERVTAAIANGVALGIDITGPGQCVRFDGRHGSRVEFALETEKGWV